jgi:hypothetical protein
MSGFLERAVARALGVAPLAHRRRDPIFNGASERGENVGPSEDERRQGNPRRFESAPAPMPAISRGKREAVEPGKPTERGEAAVALERTVLKIRAPEPFAEPPVIEAARFAAPPPPDGLPANTFGDFPAGRGSPAAEVQTGLVRSRSDGDARVPDPAGVPHRDEPADGAISISAHRANDGERIVRHDNRRAPSATEFREEARDPARATPPPGRDTPAPTALDPLSAFLGRVDAEPDEGPPRRATDRERSEPWPEDAVEPDGRGRRELRLPAAGSFLGGRQPDEELTINVSIGRIDVAPSAPPTAAPRPAPARATLDDYLRLRAAVRGR